MLTRLFVDNFRCFENFEFKPQRRQLIVGKNGTGESSFMDALVFLKTFARGGANTESFFAKQPTAWLDQDRQVFEFEAVLTPSSFVYKVELESVRGENPLRVSSEAVHVDQEPIFEFRNGQVEFYINRPGSIPRFPANVFQSALAVTPIGTDKLSQFKSWLDRLRCFRLNPFSMPPRSDGPQSAPTADLSNIARWLSHWAMEDTQAYFALHQSLRSALEGFNILRLESIGGASRYLAVEFSGAGGVPLSFGFDQLSEGQRCLICLYAILHFIVAKGGTVVIDEPENFISLREIQPWLMAVSDAAEASGGQVILISHHPELINQWAPECGVQFVRDELGAVRVEPFRGDKESALSPSELIARGWENG